jgi:hypothetical protein
MWMMDAILEIPMRDVLQKIPLDQQTKAVLSGGEDTPYPIYRLMLALEAGDWERARGVSSQMRVRESVSGELWSQAMQWARQVGAGS